jgi:hypothetical protein
LEFNLTQEDVRIPEVCPVLGIPLYFTAGHRTDNTPSVDRLDNTRGYVRGNIAVISWRANLIKRDTTLKELEALVMYLKRGGSSV